MIDPLIPLIILTHIVAYIVIRDIDLFKATDIKIENVYSAISEYLTTGSILRAKAILHGRIRREDILNLNEEGFGLTLMDKDLTLETATTDIDTQLKELDLAIENFEMKAALSTAIIIFPPILALISVIATGPLPLAITPIIQTTLLKILERTLR